MNDLEHAIKSLKFLHDVEKWSSSEPEEKAAVRRRITKEAIELLKVQEATVEPKRIDLADETKAWLDEMDAVDALGNIADICIDWDGYRTANGLGGLVNEIWAYARYCADRLLKAQEPRAIKNSAGNGICPGCGHIIPAWSSPNYCGYCGQAVKWE